VDSKYPPTWKKKYVWFGFSGTELYLPRLIFLSNLLGFVEVGICIDRNLTLHKFRCRVLRWLKNSFNLL